MNENLLEGNYELENLLRQIFELVFFMISKNYFLDVSLPRSSYLNIRSGLQDMGCMIGISLAY